MPGFMLARNSEILATAPLVNVFSKLLIPDTDMLGTLANATEVAKGTLLPGHTSVRAAEVGHTGRRSPELFFLLLLRPLVTRVSRCYNIPFFPEPSR